MTPAEHFRAGQLKEAVAAATAAVKANPGDKAARGMLFEMLCFSGDLARADVHPDVIAQQDPATLPGASLLRHLVRAEQWRRQCFEDGRLPEFIDEPTPELKLRVEALVRLREKKPAEAAALLEQAEAQRPKIAGKCDGAAFADLRDLDDLTSSFIEVLTSNGKYYWIPMDRVELLEFRAPERPLDLFWRRAHLCVRNGPDGEVYIPAMYVDTWKSSDDAVRLGRSTDWQGGDGSPVRGVGQRTFLVGEADKGLLEISTIQVNASPA